MIFSKIMLWIRTKRLHSDWKLNQRSISLFYTRFHRCPHHCCRGPGGTHRALHKAGLLPNPGPGPVPRGTRHHGTRDMKWSIMDWNHRQRAQDRDSLLFLSSWDGGYKMDLQLRAEDRDSLLFLLDSLWNCNTDLFLHSFVRYCLLCVNIPPIPESLEPPSVGQFACEEALARFDSSGALFDSHSSTPSVTRVRSSSVQSQFIDCNGREYGGQWQSKNGHSTLCMSVLTSVGHKAYEDARV